MNRRKLLILINAVVVVLTAYAFVYMFNKYAAGGALASGGFEMFKYFTVLSNLLEGAVSLVVLIRLLGGKEIPRWLQALKYAAAVSVGLTFFTVLFFLGWLYGYASMYRGANLHFHLLIPLIAMVEYVAFSEYRKPTVGESLIAIIPMVLYGAGYLTNILVNGVGEWPNTNDWYGFAAAGFPAGYFVFAFIGLATWGMSLLFLFIKKKTAKK